MSPARFETANVDPSRMLIISANMTGPLPRGRPRTLGRSFSNTGGFDADQRRVLTDRAQNNAVWDFNLGPYS
jgi:hypothetical protein